MSEDILHIYTRVSSDSQEDNTSLSGQEASGVSLAKTLKFKHKLWNEGVQSSSTETLENRPVLSELLSECTKQNVRHLYVEYTDRLSRNQSTWSVIRLTLRRNKVLLYTARNPEPIDLQDPTDDLLLGILSEVSIFDNKMRTRRMTTGRSKRISQGFWRGGPTPYGYDLVDQKLVINEYEAKWVRRIFDLYRSELSIDIIRNELMSNGVKTRRGNAVWSHGSISALLGNTHYSGAYHVHIRMSDEKHLIQCPKILDDEIYREVQELRIKRSNNIRLKQPNEKHFYFLKGLMFCGHCGLEIAGKRLPEKSRNFYYCPIAERKYKFKNTPMEDRVHKSISMKLEHTDDLVWNTVLNVIEKSVIFKEREKTELLTQNTFINANELVGNLVSEKKREEKEYATISDAIRSLTASFALNQDDDIRGAIEQLKRKRDEVSSRTIQIDEQINRLLVQKKYYDWYREFHDKVSKLRNERDDETKRRFLDGVVDRIEVFAAMNTNAEHELMIYFKMAYVDDKLVYYNAADKSLGYELIEGRSNYRVVLDPKKKLP